jgi:single-strand DNA-binding protein
MVNRVILVGNLTRDAESTAGPATTLTRMRIATNTAWRDADGTRQESAEFHSVVAFGKLGEVCASYCLKGRPVYIEGRLRTREYDGSDGLRRHSTEIVAETMKLLDRPPSGGGEVEDGAVSEPSETPRTSDDGRSSSRRRERAAVGSAP